MRLRFLLSSALLATAASAYPGSKFHRGDVQEVEMVAAAWYAGWHNSDFTLDDVSWDKYTHMTYAFMETTDDPSNTSLPDADAALLPQFVQKAHENDVKALLSFGGWTGSRFFSTNVGDAANRTKFVNAITELIQTYQLDGIDFDWEYPNKQGIGCNAISPNDTSNLLSLLQELRSTPVGSSTFLTAAVSLTPFAGSDGEPLANVSAFADVLDYIAIMNYDVWGSWSTSVGPNAPLNDTCASEENQQGSAVSAVKAWSDAGMPVSQIVLAVPAYGHSFAVNVSSAFVGGVVGGALTAYPAFNASEYPVGDAWDDPPSVDVCGVEEPQAGVQDFWNLVKSGLLTSNGSSPSAGVPYRFDDCSQTEYLYNTTSNVMISYDGPRSFASKGGFIKNTGLRGFAMWEAGGDVNDILLDSIRDAAGFEDCDY